MKYFQYATFALEFNSKLIYCMYEIAFVSMLCHFKKFNTFLARYTAIYYIRQCLKHLRKRNTIFVITAFLFPVRLLKEFAGEIRSC